MIRTVDEAQNLIHVDLNMHKIASVFESTNYFIFDVVPVNVSDKFDRPISPSIAVEKKTGKKVSFNPMRFSKEEVKSIRKIR